MGTGIVAILLHQLPYQFSGLGQISVVFLFLNIVIFIGLLFFSILRYIVWPEVFLLMLRHPVQSLFLGAVPIGFGTIITMLVYVAAPLSRGLLYFTQVLFWIDVVLAMLTCLGVPLFMIMVHEQSIDKLTAVWLLPVVAPIVAASTGANLCTVIPQDWSALHPTLIASYVLWGMGFPFAMSILVLYIHRLTVYNLPANEVIVSVFLPIGPLGLGGAAICQLGIVARNINFISAEFAIVLHGAGVLIALLCFGYAIIWTVFAVVTIASRFLKMHFSMAWWGFTFPLGTFALCCIQLGKELDNSFFSILATVVTVCVLLLWIMVAVLTVYDGLKGEIFYAPCLAKLSDNLPPSRAGTRGCPQFPQPSFRAPKPQLEYEVGQE